jgi:hypothetical protein
MYLMRSSYEYAENDPVNFADPFGLEGCRVVGDNLICSAEVTAKISRLGLLVLGGGAQGSTQNSIGPGSLEQDVPWDILYYSGPAPSDRDILSKLKGLVASKDLTDCEAMALYIGEVITRDGVTGTNEGAAAVNSAMGGATPHTLAGMAVSAILSNFSHNQGAVLLGNNAGSSSGYKEAFQQGDEDQGHHVAFYMQLGFGLNPTTLSNLAQNMLLSATLPAIGEILQGTPGNTADARLGTAAMNFGAGLRNGTISIGTAMAEFRKRFCK